MQLRVSLFSLVERDAVESIPILILSSWERCSWSNKDKKLTQIMTGQHFSLHTIHHLLLLSQHSAGFCQKIKHTSSPLASSSSRQDFLSGRRRVIIPCEDVKWTSWSVWLWILIPNSTLPPQQPPLRYLGARSSGVIPRLKTFDTITEPDPGFALNWANWRT